MNTTAQLLEFDALRRLLGRNVASPPGLAELEKVAPAADRTSRRALARRRGRGHRIPARRRAPATGRTRGRRPPALLLAARHRGFDSQTPHRGRVARRDRDPGADRIARPRLRHPLRAAGRGGPLPQAGRARRRHGRVPLGAQRPGRQDPARWHGRRSRQRPARPPAARHGAAEGLHTGLAPALPARAQRGVAGGIRRHPQRALRGAHRGRPAAQDRWRDSRRQRHRPDALRRAARNHRAEQRTGAADRRGDARGAPHPARIDVAAARLRRADPADPRHPRRARAAVRQGAVRRGFRLRHPALQPRRRPPAGSARGAPSAARRRAAAAEAQGGGGDAHARRRDAHAAHQRSEQRRQDRSPSRPSGCWR